MCTRKTGCGTGCRPRDRDARPLPRRTGRVASFTALAASVDAAQLGILVLGGCVQRVVRGLENRM